jgi:hypothetical protein
MTYVPRGMSPPQVPAWATVPTVTVLQTIAIYALIPLAIYAVLTLVTLWPRLARGPRYRPGQPWNFEPVWWSGNPRGIGQAPPPPRPAVTTGVEPDPPITAKGGARGSW